MKDPDSKSANSSETCPKRELLDTKGQHKSENSCRGIQQSKPLTAANLAETSGQEFSDGIDSFPSEVDGYRLYQLSPRKSTSQVSENTKKDEKGYTYVHFSAILAKHGISYNAGHNTDNGMSDPVRRDAADRLLDAMDKQLDGVSMTKVQSDDVNDDPGTDPDSVRSLRHRVMFDLAAAKQQTTTTGIDIKMKIEPAFVPKAKEPTEDTFSSKRITPSYRSASASRYETRDRVNTEDGLPKATQKALASSLDRLNLPEDRHVHSGAMSARNVTESRKGRDLERSRDRRRLNETFNSLETPSTLSLRQLDSPYSVASRFNRSVDEERDLSYSPYSTIPKRSNYTHTPEKASKFYNMTFDYRYKPLSTRWHSTPMDLDTRGREESSERHEKLADIPMRRFFRKIEYKDDPGSYRTRDSHWRKDREEELRVDEDLLQKKNVTSRESPSSEDALKESPVIHQLSTPEKRDQYKWRMNKMLKELDESRTPHPVEKLPEGNLAQPKDMNYDAPRILNDEESSKSSTVSAVYGGGESRMSINVLGGKNQDASGSDKDSEEHPSISEVYAKTDYHEIPNFPTTATSGTKTSSSISTEHLGAQKDLEEEERKSGSSKPESTTPSSVVLKDVKNPESLGNKGTEAKNSNLPPNSPSSKVSSEDHLARRVISSGSSSTSSSTVSPEDDVHSPASLSEDSEKIHSTKSHKKHTGNPLHSSSMHLCETIPKKVDIHPTSSPDHLENAESSSSASHDHDGKINADDVSSIHSDSTLTGDKEEQPGSGSLKTEDVPKVLRESLVRGSSDERSSLEFTLHVSSTDIESLPTSDFEANWLKRQKLRFPELIPPKMQSSTDSGEKDDPFASLSPRSKRKLTKRERMKITLAASRKRMKKFGQNQSDENESATHKRRYSWGSESHRSITTEDLLHANPDGSNYFELRREHGTGSRSNMPRSSSVASLSTVHTEDYEDRYKQLMVRHLAGVPVTSFDSVTIVSDLDSVHTEAVREHFRDSMRKHKGQGHESSTSSDSAKPASQESRSLRDRYNRLSDQEKKSHDVSQNGLDTSTPSKSLRPSPLKASYRSDSIVTDGKSDSGLQVSKATRTNDSLNTSDSILSQNGALPNRHRTPSRQSSEPRHQSTENGSLQHSPSKSNSRHSRAHSVGPTSRRERFTDSVNQRYSNDVSATTEFTKTPSRRSHRSDSLESGNDRHRITTNALNKLQELDSQIEEIESKKKTGEQELKLMEKTMEGHRINLLKLEEKLRENQAKADDARTELMVLEFKKEQCKKELDSTTKDFNQMQEKVKETEDLGMTYDDIVALMQERDELRVRFRRGEASRTTIAERQELERALHAAKDELFRERKRKREKTEELEEKLEELEHNFETMEAEKNSEIKRLEALVQNQTDKTKESHAVERADAIEAEKRNLFEKLDILTKQLQQKDNEIVSLATETNRAREENRHLCERVTGLEAKVSEQVELREKLISEAERNAHALKKEKEQAIASGKYERESEMEKILQDVEKEKERAVVEYKSEHQEEICKLRVTIENKEVEIEQLRERLHHEEDTKRTLCEKLRMDSKEQVRSALANERFAWEQEKQIADKREDDLRKSNFEKEKSQLISEVEEARNKCKIATEQISRLRTEIEDLRLESRKLLQEKLDAVTQAREQERKEQNKKLNQLRAELEEMNQTEIEKQRTKYGKLEDEFRKVKQEKNEASMKCKESTSNAERSERCFIAEVHDECQKIADLIRGIRTPSQSRNRTSSLASRSGSHLSRSNRPSNAEGAVSQLRALSDDVRATLRDLTTEAETHRRAALIAQRERDHAVSISGNSSSGSKHLSQQIAELNGHNSGDMKALAKQLAEKDNELRDIQRNMCMWKDTTAQKLAQKFEEELAVQLERKLGRHRLEHKRHLERMEEELAHLAASNGHHLSMHHEFDASSSLVPPISSTPVKVAPPNGTTGDKGTVKLLRHLQGRVKQLRAENDLLRSNSQIMDYEGFRKSR